MILVYDLQRDRRYRETLKVKNPTAHPLFRIVTGEIRDWEKPSKRLAPNQRQP